MAIANVNELEEILSTPSSADVEAMRALEGDILILGAAGKMGPSLARLARRASDDRRRILAVARFTDSRVRAELDAAGIDTIQADLLEPGALLRLPDAPNVIYMAARKFGTTGSAHLTWAMNVYLPGLVAERFRDSRAVALSTGNVYGLCSPESGGAREETPVDPQGEYAQSALGRERMFEYASDRWGTRVALLRLNYAVDLRYGVLVDIASAVYHRRPLDLRMGFVNVIWQGDANSVALRSLAYCAAPPMILNVTGPEMLSVREVAREFGRRFDLEPVFIGEESESALLSDSSRMQQLFGSPRVAASQLIDWVAHWIEIGAPLLNKPTHFESRDGKF